MNGQRAIFVAMIAVMCCSTALFTGVSFAASKSSPVQQQAPAESDEGTSGFFELIFEKELTDGFVASGHTFIVTSGTAFYDWHDSRTSLSSIRKGSIIRVRYRQENAKDPMTAVKVKVAQGPGE